MKESNQCLKNPLLGNPKLKFSRLLLNNLFRILVQNLPALEELNSKKHTIMSPTV